MSCLDEETIAAFAEARLPAARIAELEAHVRDCGSCRELVSLALAAALGRSATTGELVAPGSAPRAATGGAPGTGAPGLARGATVGRYTVLELVGRGGMGEVYAAYDPELDRKVALKLLHGDAGARERAAAARLLREAKAIASSAIPTSSSSTTPAASGSGVFIAMEFVDGQTLARLAGASSRDVSAEILQRVPGGGPRPAAAHAAGLVHRDFKPAERDGRRRRRRARHGLRPRARRRRAAMRRPSEPSAAARRAARRRLDRRPLTRTGELLGTPLYMAPEQFAAGGRRAHRSVQLLRRAVRGALRRAPVRGPPARRADGRGGGGTGAAAAARSAVPPWLRKVLLRGLSPEPATAIRR